ncbi:MAG TPA: hypothetical protein VE821_08980, partial [Pyrinomonadaceae bacterium]|nr:hypothetical protein [Pyrinomonadaceae bacterium]
MDEKRAYYSPAMQQLFSTDDAPADFRFVGTLADMVRVEPRWERAVEGVFGPALQSIIVPTPDDAARAAHWLRETGAGRASFLVVGLHGASEEVDEAAYEAVRHMSESSENSFDASANARLGDLLNAPRELLSVLKRTMPQQMNARVVQNLDDAIAHSLTTGEMCVTIEGDWVAGGQFVGAGDARTIEEGAGLLAFKRELRELDVRSSELESEMGVAGQAVERARSELTELEDAVVLLNEAIGREERDTMARELSAQQLAQEIERAARHIRVVADDAARLEQERLELEERRERALEEAEAAEAARSAALQSVTEAAALVAIARRQAEAESEGLS